MSTPPRFSRRQIIGSAGVAAAAIALPNITDGAPETVAKADAPRLPLVILDREGLIPEQAQKIRELSPDIKILNERNALESANVIFGGASGDDVKRASKLRWMQFPAAGVESVLSPELVGSEIILTNAQGCYAPEIAEHAFGLLFGLTRGIATHIRQMPNHKWAYDGEPIELRGMTMGIIGLGGIGREVARRAKAMDMHVIAVDAEPMFGERFAMVDEVHLVDDWLDEMLRRSDVLVMAAPHTARTRGMLGAKQFDTMKQGAYFINVSRGKTVKTAELAAALKSGHLAGAGLDVTDPEPLPADHELWEMPNVILTSHIAGRSQLGRARVHVVFAENVRRYIAGLPLLNVVDKNKGY